jgi:hypothetical protein
LKRKTNKEGKKQSLFGVYPKGFQKSNKEIGIWERNPRKL